MIEILRWPMISKLKMLSLKFLMLDSLRILSTSKMAQGSSRVSSSNSPSLMPNLKLLIKELSKLSSPIVVNDDACATNSITCEASILKENVELRAQLEVLSSNYGKLEESHEKLSSSHDDLLVSHSVLNIAHEAMIAKVTSVSLMWILALLLVKIVYCHVLVLVIHLLTMLVHLVMNCFPCLVALTMKLILPLVLVLRLTM